MRLEKTCIISFNSRMETPSEQVLTFFFSEKREEIAKIKDELRTKGMEVPPDKPASEHFDSNCITPVSSISLYMRTLTLILKMKNSSSILYNKATLK